MPGTHELPRSKLRGIGKAKPENLKTIPTGVLDDAIGYKLFPALIF
jgi:hypothetical protein